MAKRRVKVITVKCGECSYKYQVTVKPGERQKTFCPKCLAPNDAFKKMNPNIGVKKGPEKEEVKAIKPKRTYKHKK